ncbi:MAG: PAS domain S-box protein [Bacteroidales bacterium]|nr:PAS domain S-box protein [Bacteroidales bacterium]MBN2756040.1 PAS domain S-box protein [Bacteroidales bacterium]
MTKNSRIVELEKKIAELEKQLINSNSSVSISDNNPAQINSIANELEISEKKLQQKTAQTDSLKKHIENIEKQFRLITNNAKDIIYRYSLKEKKYEFINHAVYNILEYTPEEFYKKPSLFRNSILEDWKEIYDENWKKLLEDKRVKPLEFQSYTKYGDIVWLYQHINIITDNQHTAIAIEGSISNITNRKQAELNLKKKNIEYLALNEEYIETNEELRNSNKELLQKNEALIRSEDQYKVAIEQAGDGIFISDENGYLMNINNSGCRLTGYNVSELKKFKINDLFFINKKPKQSETIFDKVKSGQAFTSEKLILRKDGSIVPVEINIKQLSDGRYHAIFRDVSERKRSEELLKENEIRFRSLFENMSNNVAIFEVFDDGNEFIFKNFNSSAEKLENVKRENILGKNAVSVFPALSKYGLLESFKKVWKTGTATDHPVIIFDDNNKVISWTENFIYKLPSNEIVVIYDDITERKKSEFDLIKTKERYRIATEETKVAVWERNPETGVGHADSVLFEILGYPIPAVEDSFSRWKNYILDEDLEKIQQLNDALIHNKIKELNCKFRAKDIDGNIRWFLDKGVALRNKSGETTRLIGTILDITQQQKIEEELILAKEKAEEADNIKSTFLANMSHEIRTPMNGILGFSDLLKNDLTTPEERKSYIDIIHKSGKQLLNIINDILDISKIEVGQIQINEEDCSINELMDDLFTLFKPDFIDKKNIEFSLHKDLDDKDSIITTDGMRVRQILTNLINNAIKFTSNGLVEFGYILMPSETNHINKLAFIQFYVKDSGIGIPINKREIIFDRFRQSDESHTRKYGGTGLGLAISKGFVELLGGKIWHESLEKKGSTFYFTIPYKIGNPKLIKKIEAKLSKEYNWNNNSVLIVEDDDISYLYLEKILNKTKLKIYRATNGIEAYEICRKNSDIDIVLMDIQLPGVNGYEATKQIKKIKPSLPIIAQTAHALTEDKKKSIAAGCDEFITKPIKRQILLSAIEKYIKPLEIKII